MGRKSRLKKMRRGELGAAKSSEEIDVVLKKVDREAKRGLPNSDIITFKEWPCQMDNRYKVLLPIQVVPFLDTDGKLYFKDNDGKAHLIVSRQYLLNQAIKENLASIKAKEAQDKAVQKLEPTVLGDDVAK